MFSPSEIIINADCTSGDWSWVNLFAAALIFHCCSKLQYKQIAMKHFRMHHWKTLTLYNPEWKWIFLINMLISRFQWNDLTAARVGNIKSFELWETTLQLFIMSAREQGPEQINRNKSTQSVQLDPFSWKGSCLLGFFQRKI